MSTIHTFTAEEGGSSILENLNTNFDNINDDLVVAESDIATLQGQIPVLPASTSVKGPTRISVAPVLVTNPIAVGDNDPRVPTQEEKDALAGTTGTPSATNKFVTETDPSFTGLVKLTGDQTIDGVKTFTSIPVLPATDPTLANQAVRKSYADSLVSSSSGTADGSVLYDRRGKLYFNFRSEATISGAKYGVLSDADTRNRIATVLGITISSYFEYQKWSGGSSVEDFTRYNGTWNLLSNQSSATMLTAILAA